MLNRSLFLLPVLFASALALAADTEAKPELEPILCKRGNVLHDLNFDPPADKSKIPEGGFKLEVKDVAGGSLGNFEIVDGVFRGSEKAEDKRMGARTFNKQISDAIVEFDFRFNGAKFFEAGFNRVPGGKPPAGSPGHHNLANVHFESNEWFLEFPYKKPAEQAGKEAEKFENGKWYHAMIEFKKGEMAATVNGKTLRGKAPDLSVMKTGLVIRVGGADGKTVDIDNIKFFQALNKPEPGKEPKPAAAQPAPTAKPEEKKN